VAESGFSTLLTSIPFFDNFNAIVCIHKNRRYFVPHREVVMEEVEKIFDHVGIPTDEKQPHEDWVESTRVWVTNPVTQVPG
jgi:hypothetical protein